MWSQWGHWGSCTDTCDKNGTRTRQRTCIEPKDGGDPCQGNEKETLFCPCHSKYS